MKVPQGETAHKTGSDHYWRRLEGLFWLLK